MRTLAFSILLFSIACGDDSTPTVGVDAAVDAAVDMGLDGATVDAPGVLPPLEIGGDRPARVVVPASYDSDTPTPLILLLHGYSANAGLQDIYFGLRQKTRARGMLLVLPEGTVDTAGNQFWNATPGCCDFAASGTDDVGYLSGLIDEMKTHYNVDADRVYLLGHSNGGFMSYRMACDASDQIAAIASLAGATFEDMSRCSPDRPVSVLQIHGTLDDTIPYVGRAGAFPSASVTVERFATRAGCSSTGTGSPLDLDTVAGDETAVLRWTGCDAGLGAELWSIEEAGHLPPLNRTATGAILDWLLTHERL